MFLIMGIVLEFGSLSCPPPKEEKVCPKEGKGNKGQNTY